MTQEIVFKAKLSFSCTPNYGCLIESLQSVFNRVTVLSKNKLSLTFEAITEYGLDYSKQDGVRHIVGTINPITELLHMFSGISIYDIEEEAEVYDLED